ncbi:MAG: hypothetical protein ACOY3P_22290 [Planctomycetota bacterium]
MWCPYPQCAPAVPALTITFAKRALLGTLLFVLPVLSWIMHLAGCVDDSGGEVPSVLPTAASEEAADVPVQWQGHDSGYQAETSGQR